MVQIRIRTGCANFEESVLYKLVGVCLPSLISPHHPPYLLLLRYVLVFYTRLLDKDLFSLAASNPLIAFRQYGIGIFSSCNQVVGGRSSAKGSDH